MVKLKIGLYKHKETGQFDVMIDQVDNTIKVHNGEFELVKEFEHIEKTKEDILREECESLKSLVKDNFEDFLTPIFENGKTSDFLDDDKINCIRTNLYDFMCKRRELLKVNKFKYEGD